MKLPFFKFLRLRTTLIVLVAASVPSLVLADIDEPLNTTHSVEQRSVSGLVAIHEHTLEEQKQILISWLHGEFSNLKHIFEQGPVGGYPPILMRHSRIDIGQEIGLHVKQSSLLAPTEIYREHLYHFRLNARNNTIIQDIYLIPQEFEGELYRDEHGFSEQLELLSGCSITWRAEDTALIGFRDGDFCAFRDEHERVVSISSRLEVNAQQMNVIDTAVADDGEPLLGDVEGNALRLDRIRFFNTQLTYLPAGANANDDTQWVEAVPQRPLHDHEQRVTLLDNDETLFLGHDIQLIGYADQPELLRMRVYRQTEDEPVYAEDMEYVGEGVWRATSDRLRVQLTLAESVTDVLQR